MASKDRITRISCVHGRPTWRVPQVKQE